MDCEFINEQPEQYRWLRTQGGQSRSHFSQDEMDGWLIGQARNIAHDVVTIDSTFAVNGDQSPQ